MLVKWSIGTAFALAVPWTSTDDERQYETPCSRSSSRSTSHWASRSPLLEALARLRDFLDRHPHPPFELREAGERREGPADSVPTIRRNLDVVIRGIRGRTRRCPDRELAASRRRSARPGRWLTSRRRRSLGCRGRGRSGDHGPARRGRRRHPRRGRSEDALGFAPRRPPLDPDEDTARGARPAQDVSS
jgi:hypothetical protein